MIFDNLFVVFLVLTIAFLLLAQKAKVGNFIPWFTKNARQERFFALLASVICLVITIVLLLHRWPVWS